MGFRAAPFERRRRGLSLRVYLDACCLNRLTDDQSQARIHNEAEAVEGVLRLVRDGLGQQHRPRDRDRPQPGSRPAA